MAWSRAFQKCIICHFLDKFFFANIYTIKLDFAIKNSIFPNLQIFLQILKEEHKSFLMMYHLSYWPPPSVSWFSSTPAGIGLMLIGILAWKPSFSLKQSFFIRTSKPSKNIPMFLQSSPIQIWGKSAEGFLSSDRTFRDYYYFLHSFSRSKYFHYCYRADIRIYL